eukprot:6014116-Pyramimonas_sp.AAC.1
MDAESQARNDFTCLRRRAWRNLSSRTPLSHRDETTRAEGPNIGAPFDAPPTSARRKNPKAPPKHLRMWLMLEK